MKFQFQFLQVIFAIMIALLQCNPSLASPVPHPLPLPAPAPVPIPRPYLSSNFGGLAGPSSTDGKKQSKDDSTSSNTGIHKFINKGSAADKAGGSVYHGVKDRVRAPHVDTAHAGDGNAYFNKGSAAYKFGKFVKKHTGWIF